MEIENLPEQSKSGIASNIVNRILRQFDLNDKEILIKKLSPDVNLPSFKSDGASGLDLEAHLNDIIIKPGKYTLVPTGIALLMPEKCEHKFDLIGLALKME